jgi:iron complex outermembrane receptor protein
MSIERSAFALPRRCALVLAAILLFTNAATAQQMAAATPGQGTDLTELDLEQLLNIEVVFAASKRAQQPRDVPSFVSVVTAAEIKTHGYRTLADVLQTLPSFYVSNDRNYSYVGVRGFERSGDYNTRILLLLNGLRTNDNVYDLAFVGEEFIVDVDMIERVEVIRGPSAAVYGSSAFFAVINVVTKEGSRLQGGEVAATAASFGTFAGRASYGRTFANDVDVLVSASYSDGKGQRLYFPEFDAPSTNNGVADGADREDFHKLFASVIKGDFSFQASNVSREKGIPTGAFGVLFNDERSRTIDGLTLASLSYHRSFSRAASLTTRLHGGRYTYSGAFAYDPGLAASREGATGEWWGVDVDAAHTFLSRHFLTVGVEYRDNFRQDQKNFDPEPYVLYADVRNSSTRWGMFVQDEIKLLQVLMLYTGVRFDRYEAFGSTTSPRVGLIYTPDAATTVKVLAGRAFRAPNEFELHFQSSQFKANPRLEPERIETLELVAQHFIGRGIQISASTFRNRLSALVTQQIDPTGNYRLVFQNAEQIESQGVELGLEMNRGRGVTGQLTYSFQVTEDLATGVELANSPRHMVKLQLLAPLAAKRVTAGLDAQYVGTRRTLAENTAPGYVVTNLSMLTPRTFGLFDVSATAYNLFDVEYGNPGSDSHAQDVLQQDGRHFRVKTTWHY